MNSVPIPLNKAAMRKYEDLEVPCQSILAAYVWVDGSGINLRSKDRTFDFIPKGIKDLPTWYFDGSNTSQANPDNSDTFLFPQQIYHDPFRRGSHILVLADTYQHNYQPTPAADPNTDLSKVVVRLGGFHLLMSFIDAIGYIMSGSGLEDIFKLIYAENCVQHIMSGHAYASNFRKNCVILCDKGEVEEPWFGFNQEFFLTTTDDRPLGWPPGGFPAPPGPYYCAIGANKIVARDLMEAFYRCCLFAGVQLNGINPGTTPSQWNFQVGPSPGLRSADDLWMARYILARLAEEYGTVASFEPQPVENWPGNGTFVYFSSKDMREEDGILVIERAIDKLARRHGAHINEYDAKNGADNMRRLTGQNGMPHIRDFTAGVANRNCSVRIPRQVSEDKKGYLEDRRPAANADPYRVICIMLRTCLFDE